MNLYFKHGKKLSSISDIQLKDFVTPSVGKTEIDHEVEPAIWFKTLIIDSLQVDCDVRNVYWREKTENYESSELDTESTRVVPRMTRAAYDEGDCEDFELFDAVIKLLKRIENKSVNEENRAQEILRIMHLYILPEIVLKTHDVTLLQGALENVEHRIGTISEEIESKNRGIYLTENSLRNQRDQLFTSDNFESEQHVSSCSSLFLKELLSDVEKDIDTMSFDLEARQSEVERLRGAVTDEGKENLKRLRNKRDEIYTALEKYQGVRETIKNVTVRERSAKKRKKVKPNVFHEIYIELKCRLVKEKRLVKLCCDQKLKITSIREAIVQARDDLLHKGESYGFETSRDGQGTSTDVLEIRDEKPENWQTIEYKVKTILQDNTSGPALAFKSFCDPVIVKIIAFISENEFFAKSDESEQTKLKLGEDSDEFENISYLESFSLQTPEQLDDSRISSGFRPFTHAIKKDILTHIEDQSKWLMNCIGLENYMEKGQLLSVELPHKVWICYESQLYSHIATPLSQLYCISYAEVASKLHEFLSKSSLLELDIDEPWLKDGYIPIPSSTERKYGKVPTEAMKNASLKSGLSITLGNMTLDELYRSAKRDCDNIPEFLDCPLDEIDDEVFDEGRSSFIKNVNEDENASMKDENGIMDQSCEIKGVLNDQSASAEDARSSLYLRVLGEQPTIAEVLQPACDELQHCIETAPVVEKFKCMTKAYKIVNRKVCKLKRRQRPSSIESMVCCDEILSASIVLLTLLKKEEFVNLYAHLNMMIDLMPNFLTGSIHDCSLTNFYSAFQYLFDKQVSLNRVSR